MITNPFHRLRMLVLALLGAVVLLFTTATPALAYEPVGVVHAERVAVGPYTVTVGFSVWPIRAMQSLDYSFMPDGGIAGKSGTVNLPGADPEPLARHPRKLDVWGLDIRAVPNAGVYTIAFAIDGPAGHGEGALTGVEILDQPGPPLGLSWAVGALPFLGLVAFLAIAWRRTSARPTVLPTQPPA
jgi:hypothetical protein